LPVCHRPTHDLMIEIGTAPPVNRCWSWCITIGYGPESELRSVRTLQFGGFAWSLCICSCCTVLVALHDPKAPSWQSSGCKDASYWIWYSSIENWPCIRNIETDSHIYSLFYMTLCYGTSYGPMSVCVCLSQVSVLSTGMNWLICFFWTWRLFFYQSFKEIQVSIKIRVLPSGTFSKLRP